MRKLASLLPFVVLLIVVASAHAVVGNLQFHCPPYQDPANPSVKYIRSVDPQISFGVDESAHPHFFWGNMGPGGQGLTKNTTMADLLKPGNPSSCFVQSNRSAGWAPPIVLVDGTLVAGANVRYYFRNPGGQRIMFPSGGFKQVIGDSHNINDYGSVARWQCINGALTSDPLLWMPNEDWHGTKSNGQPWSCASPATLQVTARDGNTCWDGNRTGPGMGGNDGPANGRSHKEPCDAAHPYRLPVLDFVIDFPHAALTPGARLASDPAMGRPGLTFHVDQIEVFSGQDPVTGFEPQSRLLNLCMNQVEGPELGGLPVGYPPMDPNGLSCQEVDDQATHTGVVWVTTRNVPLSQAGPNRTIPAVVH